MKLDKDNYKWNVFESKFDVTSKQVDTLAASGTWKAKGGTITVNGSDPAQIDITEEFGFVSDAHTDPLKAVTTPIQAPAAVGITLDNLATHDFTFLYRDINAGLVQRTAEIDPIEERDLYKVGGILHSSRTQVDAINPTGNAVGYSVINTISALFRIIGTMNADGNVYAPSVATPGGLALTKNFGKVGGPGLNAHIDRKNPDILEVLANATLSFNYTYSDFAGGGTTEAPVALLDPNTYNNAGTLTTVPNNKFTIQRITLTGAGTGIEYGQNIYSDLESALIAYENEAFITSPILQPGGLLRAWVIVKQGTTDLNSALKVKFIHAGTFGSGAATSAGGGLTSIQQAYLNSTDPELVLTALLGALTIRGDTGDTLSRLFEIQNNLGTIDYMVVKKAQTEINKLIVGAILGAEKLTIDGTTITGSGPTFLINAFASNPVEISPKLKVDNIEVDGNKIASLDTNGDIILGPNGSGIVDITSRYYGKATGHAGLTGSANDTLTGTTKGAVTWGGTQTALDSLMISHSTTVNNSEITYDVAGAYFVSAAVLFNLTASALGAHSIVAEFDTGSGYVAQTRTLGSCITTTSGSATSNTANSHFIYVAAAGDKMRFTGVNVLAGTNSLMVGTHKNLAIYLIGD